MRQLSILSAAFLCSITFASQPVRIHLTDGSTLMARTNSDTICLHSPNVKPEIEVRLERVASINRRKNQVCIEFKDGDQLAGQPAKDDWKFKAIFGNVRIPFEQITQIEFMDPQKPETIAAVPQPRTPQSLQVSYADLTWDSWRTIWESDEELNRLTAIGKIRPGFDYGHWGKGRGPMTITGNADKSWQDYELAFDYEMKAATRDFFHASIPGESRGMHVYVRAQSMTESWNEPDTAYVIGINPAGGWSIAAYKDFCYVGPGWTPAQNGIVESYVAGKAELPLREPGKNRLRIRVVGPKITLWLNDEMLTEFTHEEGGKIEPIPFGGFGFEWKFESLGWIGNLEFERL